MSNQEVIIMEGRFASLKEAADVLEKRGINARMVRPSTCNPNS